MQTRHPRHPSHPQKCDCCQILSRCPDEEGQCKQWRKDRHGRFLLGIGHLAKTRETNNLRFVHELRCASQLKYQYANKPGFGDTGSPSSFSTALPRKRASCSLCSVPNMSISVKNDGSLSRTVLSFAWISSMRVLHQLALPTLRSSQADSE